jgi:hypothetical protein
LPPALELAQAQYVAQQQLVQATATAGLQMWAQVDPANLTTSWGSFLSRLLVILRGAQVAAASTADSYVSEVLHAQGFNVPAAGRVAATALSGVASDGRPLETLLLNPVIATKEMIGRGADVQRAMATGHATLEMALRTQVGDAGRVAAGVAIAARPRTGWTRMLVGSSCYRCVILAGRVYRYSDGFERHPQDDCIHIPAAEDVVGDYTTDARKAFDEGRVHGLSQADEEAIRAGADMAQVANAHSGMYVAGAGKLTRTGTTHNAFAGRRLAGNVRLMPEQIYRETSSRDEAVAMLRQHGYLI